MDTPLHTIVRESPELAPRTREKYLRDIDAWIAFAGASPTGWTRTRAQEYYNRLLGHMKPQSANRTMAALGYASRWWHTRFDGVDFAVVQQAAAQTTAARRALDTAEAQALLATCAGTSAPAVRDYALIVLGLETGMRRMSLAGATLDGLVRQHDYLTARVPLKGRGEDLFAVPLSDTAIAAIEPWRRWLRGHKITKGALFRALPRQVDAQGRTGHGVSATPLTEVGIYKIIAHRAEQAGLARCYPHILRHTFITWRLQAGLAPYEIAAITGHRLAGTPGLGGLGSYIDGTRIAEKARQHTPAWLAQHTRKES